MNAAATGDKLASFTSAGGLRASALLVGLDEQRLGYIVEAHMDAACTQASVAPCFAHCAGDSTVYMYTSFRSHTWFVIGSSLPTSKRFRATVALKSRVTRGHQPGGFSLPQDLLTTTIFQCNVSVPNKANVGSPCVSHSAWRHRRDAPPRRSLDCRHCNRGSAGDFRRSTGHAAHYCCQLQCRT